MSTPNLAILHIQPAQNTKEATANNAFDALDEAITQLKPVAMPDANYVPATADALGNAGFVLTGALTAGRNFTVPNNKKRYIISNQTTGGFNVTIKTAAGTGVAIAPSAYHEVLCDGTNVVSLY